MVEVVKGSHRVRVGKDVDLYQAESGTVYEEYGPEHRVISYRWCVAHLIYNQHVFLWNSNLTVPAVMGYFNTSFLRLAEVSYDYSNGIQ